MKIICPGCQKEGKKSVSTHNHSLRTLIAQGPQQYDENGDPIPRGPDPNVTTSYYSCSNGHRFEIRE